MKVKVEYLACAEVEIPDDYKFMTEVSSASFNEWFKSFYCSKLLNKRFESTLPNWVHVEKVSDLKTKATMYRY